MKDEKLESELDFAARVFSFLRGNLPEGTFVSRKNMPKLTEDQAWTVIWFLGNEYRAITDHVERCDVCGNLFDTWNAGGCLDYGKAPYHFCDNCFEGEAYTRKMRRNPDKAARKEYFAD